MNCSACGHELESDSAFCRFCGSRAGATAQLPARRLTRRPEEGRIAGVCAGMAEYFDTDVAVVRLVWVILSLFPGGIVGGVIAYLAAWLIIPVAAAPAPVRSPAPRLQRSVVDRQIAGVCGGLAAYFGVDSTIVRLIWVILSIVPGAIVLGVVAYVLAWIIMPEEASLPVHSPTAAS